MQDSGELLLNGTLELRLPESTRPAVGDTFVLFDITAPLGHAFDDVSLPQLADDREWDTSALYSAGIISVR